MTTANPIDKSKKTPVKSFRFTGPWLLSCLAIIFAIVAVLSVWWSTQDQHQSNISAQLQQVKQNTASNSAQIQAYQQILQSQLQDQQKTIFNLQNQLNQTALSRSSAEKQTTLMQIGYLVHLANLHLSVGHDTKTSLQMLNMAKQLLIPLGDDSSLYTLNNSLTRDIEHLQNTSQPEISDVVTRLDTINNSIQQLTLTHRPSNPSIIQAPVKTTLSSWYKNTWRNLKETINGMVIIRENRKPVIAQLSSEQEIVVKNNIQFKILLAQWAIIHQQPTLYQESLGQAQRWIKDYFGENPAAENIAKQISLLAQIDIAPQLPNINDSINAVNEATKQFYSTPTINNVQILKKNDVLQPLPKDNNKPMPERPIQQGVSL